MKSKILITLLIAALALTGCMSDSGTLGPERPIDIMTQGMAVTAVLPATLTETWVAPDANLYLAGDGYEFDLQHLIARVDTEKGVATETNNNAFGYDGMIVIDDIWKDDGWQEGVWMEAEVEAWEIQTKEDGSFLDLYMGFNSDRGHFVPILNVVGAEYDYWVTGHVIDEDRDPMGTVTDMGSALAHTLSFD